MSALREIVSCLDGYDPDALHVDKAREAMRACIAPITATEPVPVRTALGRILAEDIVPRINVPSHDNSALDGYAVRFAELDKRFTEIAGGLSDRAFAAKGAAGQCVRIMS